MAGNQTQQSSPKCCLDHDPVTGAPLLRPSLLTPSPNPRPLPDLLPFKKGKKLHEDMAEAHPYAFDMVGTNVLPPQDYKEACQVLMERNMPDVLHNRQMEAVYIPPTPLPTRPIVVDLPRFESRKRKWDEIAQKEGPAVLQQLGMRPGPPEDLQIDYLNPHLHVLKRF